MNPTEVINRTFSLYRQAMKLIPYENEDEYAKLNLRMNLRHPVYSDKLVYDAIYNIPEPTDLSDVTELRYALQRELIAKKNYQMMDHL